MLPVPLTDSRSSFTASLPAHQFPSGLKPASTYFSKFTFGELGVKALPTMVSRTSAACSPVPSWRALFSRSPIPATCRLSTICVSARNASSYPVHWVSQQQLWAGLALSWILKPADVSGRTVFRGSGTSTRLMPSLSALPTSAGGGAWGAPPAPFASCTCILTPCHATTHAPTLCARLILEALQDRLLPISWSKVTAYRLNGISHFGRVDSGQTGVCILQGVHHRTRVSQSCDRHQGTPLHLYNLPGGRHPFWPAAVLFSTCVGYTFAQMSPIHDWHLVTYQPGMWKGPLLKG